MPFAMGYLCRRISSGQAVVQPTPEQPVQRICVQGQLLFPRSCSNAGELQTSTTLADSGRMDAGQP